jgi:hypothetical protein
MKRVRVTWVQIPTPSQQQGGLLVHCDGFSSNNMCLNSSLFGKFWRGILFLLLLFIMKNSDEQRKIPYSFIIFLQDQTV